VPLLEVHERLGHADVPVALVASVAAVDEDVIRVLARELQLVTRAEADDARELHTTPEVV